MQEARSEPSSSKYKNSQLRILYLGHKPKLGGSQLLMYYVPRGHSMQQGMGYPGAVTGMFSAGVGIPRVSFTASLEEAKQSQKWWIEMLRDLS